MTELIEEYVPTRGSRAALAGFVFAALFVLAQVLLVRSPDLSSSDADLAEYFGSESQRRASLIVGLYLAPSAAVAFIWFSAAFRHRVITVGGREHALFASVYTIAAALFTVSIFLVGAVELASVWVAESSGVDVSELRTLEAIGTALAQLVALRAGAVFIAVSTTRALRCGLFPRWFAILSYVMAVALMLVATTWRFVVLATPAWVAAASVFVLLERRRSVAVVAA